jgi:hypothetical protein
VQTEGWLAMLMVTGATGTIGRPLIDLLTTEAAEVRAVTRDPLAAGLPDQVEVVEGDPSHPDTIAPSLKGITGDVTGRPLSYHEIPPEVARQGMVRNGFPEPFADTLMARYAKGAGQAALVSGAVEQILGRPARTYAQWVADHAAAFRN